jgi:hypothetical protein
LTNADRALLLITRSGAYAKTFLFYFGQMTVPNGLIAFCPLCSGSFSGIPQTSKPFKLPTLWLLDLASESCGWLKQKTYFSGKTNRHNAPAAPIKLAPLSMSLPIISLSCLLIFSGYFHSCRATIALDSMATESTIDLPPTNLSIDDDAGGDSGQRALR